MPNADQLSILFLTPAFLANRLHKRIRGVEIFDLHLVRQIAQRGHRITVPADSSWKHRFPEDHWGDAPPEILYTSSLRRPLWNALTAALRLRRRRFDMLIIGNTGRGIMPGIHLLNRAGVFPRATLIAHRVGSPSYLRAIRNLPIDIIAVSDRVADSFRIDPALRDRVSVQYGIPNPDDFTPPERNPAAQSNAGDGIIRFCLVGKLDDPWKGATDAIEAFCALPEDIRSRCLLELASYDVPPGEMPPGVIAHEWMPFTKMRDVYFRADVCLATSTSHETFCQALVQGMLAGLPVITSSLPILVEKLDQGAGLKYKTVAQLTSHMERLARDAQLRRQMGARARATALARYTWDTGAFLNKIAPGAEPPEGQKSSQPDQSRSFVQVCAGPLRRSDTTHDSNQ